MFVYFFCLLNATTDVHLISVNDELMLSFTHYSIPDVVPWKVYVSFEPICQKNWRFNSPGAIRTVYETYTPHDNEEQSRLLRATGLTDLGAENNTDAWLLFRCNIDSAVEKGTKYIRWILPRTGFNSVAEIYQKIRNATVNNNVDSETRRALQVVKKTKDLLPFLYQWRKVMLPFTLIEYKMPAFNSNTFMIFLLCKLNIIQREKLHPTLENYLKWEPSSWWSELTNGIPFICDIHDIFEVLLQSRLGYHLYVARFLETSLYRKIYLKSHRIKIGLCNISKALTLQAQNDPQQTIIWKGSEYNKD